MYFVDMLLVINQHQLFFAWLTLAKTLASDLVRGRHWP